MSIARHAALQESISSDESESQVELCFGPDYASKGKELATAFNNCIAPLPDLQELTKESLLRWRHNAFNDPPAIKDLNDHFTLRVSRGLMGNAYDLLDQYAIEEDELRRALDYPGMPVQSLSRCTEHVLLKRILTVITGATAADKKLLYELFEKPTRLIDYATDQHLMEICKLFWGAIKKLDGDHHERRSLLKTLSGPMPEKQA